MKDKGVGFRIFFYILTLILTIVLIFSIIRVSFGADTISFRSFLEYTSTTPSVDISYIEYVKIGGDWGLIDGLRTFLNYIMTIVNVALWLCKNVANLLVFVFYYVRFLFV